MGERFRDKNVYLDAGQVASGAIAGVGVGCVWLCGLVKPQESEGRMRELPVGKQLDLEVERSQGLREASGTGKHVTGGHAALGS